MPFIFNVISQVKYEEGGVSRSTQLSIPSESREVDFDRTSTQIKLQ